MDVRIIAIPFDSGRRAYRMGRGPDALVEGGFATSLTKSGHRVTLSAIDAQVHDPPDPVRTGFALCATLATELKVALAAGEFPIVLTGNCFLACGVVPAIPAKRVGVIWCDAHGDLNTPQTSVSGFLDGMALATLLGRCWHDRVTGIPGFAAVAPQDVVLVGVRDLDPPEAELIADLQLPLVRPDTPTEDITMPTDVAYLHVDVDVLDAEEIRANEFAAPGGFTVQGLIDFLHHVTAQTHIGAVTLSAYDPALDPESRMPDIASRIVTALLDDLG